MLNTVQRMVESVPCRQCPSDNLLMKSLPCNVHSFVLSPPQPRLVTVRPNGLWPAWLILVGVLIPPLTKVFVNLLLQLHSDETLSGGSSQTQLGWLMCAFASVEASFHRCLCWGQFLPLPLWRPVFTFVFVEANFHLHLKEVPAHLCWAGMWRCCCNLAAWWWKVDARRLLYNISEQYEGGRCSWQMVLLSLWCPTCWLVNCNCTALFFSCFNPVTLLIGLKMHLFASSASTFCGVEKDKLN